jgi:hypothetical protein
MRRDASPGPDGLKVAFYKEAWLWIAHVLLQLITHFYTTSNLPDHTNQAHIVLIPKKQSCTISQDCRPISLCNVFYKICAKSLAERAKNHLPHLIHHAQHAFVKGRHITTNIIIAQEIAHTFNLASWKDKGFMLKFDLAKAFGRIECSFIVQALRRQGFHGHFIDLVRTCMETATFSALINGQSYGPIRAERGIRQGCLLSPYLFVIAINELSIYLQQALEDNHLSGIKLGPDCPPIHSLMFPDDLIICGNTDQQQAVHIASILQIFCRKSGQTPNWNKSSILFSKHVDQQTRDSIKSIFPV